MVSKVTPNAGAVVQSLEVEGDSVGVSATTVARRLSVISGFFAFLQVRGDVATIRKGVLRSSRRPLPGQDDKSVSWRAARPICISACSKPPSTGPCWAASMFDWQCPPISAFAWT